MSEGSDAVARRQDAIVGWFFVLGFLLVSVIGLTSSGFGPYSAVDGAARQPTWWDWMELLIVPVVLAGGAYWLNKNQRDTELRIAADAREAERQYNFDQWQYELGIAQDQREVDIKIATERRNQSTLEDYYDRMTELLLDHDLRESELGSEVRSIARARTIAAIRSLGSVWNRQLLAFLDALNLLVGNRYESDPPPVVDLRRADLSGADLRQANLTRVDLSNADLSDANMDGCSLEATVLESANLSGAAMRGCHMMHASLKSANLERADLTGASLLAADLSWTRLNKTNLTDADLRDADLEVAWCWSIEQIEEAKYFGATYMPDKVMIGTERNLYGKRIEGVTFEQWKADYLAKEGGTPSDLRNTLGCGGG